VPYVAAICMDERLDRLFHTPHIVPLNAEPVAIPLKDICEGGGTSFFTDWNVVGRGSIAQVVFTVRDDLLTRSFRLAWPSVTGYILGEHLECLWWLDFAAEVQKRYGLTFTAQELIGMQHDNVRRVAARLTLLTFEATGRDVPAYLHYTHTTPTGIDEVDYLGAFRLGTVSA
jgi:hypothetical protein